MKFIKFLFEPWWFANPAREIVKYKVRRLPKSVALPLFERELLDDEAQAFRITVYEGKSVQYAADVMFTYRKKVEKWRDSAYDKLAYLLNK